VQDWGDDVCWMNPPYGRQMAAWMEKAYRSSLAGATVLAFVPSRTGTRWWHAWVLGKAEIRYRQGRTIFVGATDPAGFDSVAVLYRPSW
jgi:DNA N-6-adenine-methyltransferase (Dam)